MRNVEEIRFVVGQDKEDTRASVVISGPDHYSIKKIVGNEMEYLRFFFGEKGNKVNDLNFILFSTSGIHGCYTTIEQVEEDSIEHGETVTFLIVQPRIVAMKYGNVTPKTKGDFEYLKMLRAKSHKIIKWIGK